MGVTSQQRVFGALENSMPDRISRFYRDVPELGTRLLEDLHLSKYEDLLPHDKRRGRVPGMDGLQT